MQIPADPHAPHVHSPLAYSPSADSPRLARRQFNAFGLAALAALGVVLPGCGGGTQGQENLAEGGEGGPAQAEAQPRALSTVGAGMQGLTEWTVASAEGQVLALKSLNRLASGEVALVWTESPLPGAVGPRRLRLQRLSCQGGCAMSQRLLVEGLVDASAALTVLPDGGTLVAWRDTLERVRNHPLSVQCRLFLQRFTPTGTPVSPPELVDAFLFSNRLEGGGRTLGPPAIGHWEDGSFVVTWADLRTFSGFPGLATSVRARRYHTNGWPVAPSQTVATNNREETYSLELPPASGGYVISHVQEPQAPFHQAILPLDFWNPLPAPHFAGLLPGSFYLSMGIFGSLLFAGRADAATGRPVYTRERFAYSGHPVGSPAPLASLPLGGVALKNVEFLTLRASGHAGPRQAQRMDKYGRMIGTPFDLPEGMYLLLDDGSLLVAWTTGGATGSTSVSNSAGTQGGATGNRLMLQRFVPNALSPGLASV